MGSHLEPILGPKIGSKFVNVWVNFGSLFWGLGVLWVPLGSLLGPLEALLGGLWTPKTSKNDVFFRFLKMQLFGSLELLMTLLGSSCPLLGPIWSQNGSKIGPKSGPKTD